MDYPLKRKSHILIEYVLIKGLNDNRDSARQLAGFLKPLKAKVNLIPVNPDTDSRFEAPSLEDTNRFHGWLNEHGLFVRTRTARGLCLAAGCGQLGGKQAAINH